MSAFAALSKTPLWSLMEISITNFCRIVNWLSKHYVDLPVIETKFMENFPMIAFWSFSP